MLKRLAKVEAAGYTLEPDETALKRPPRGYEDITDPTVLDLLRRKSLIYKLPLTQAALKSPKIVTALADFASATLPLLQFGWDAVDSRSTL